MILNLNNDFNSYFYVQMYFLVLLAILDLDKLFKQRYLIQAIVLVFELGWFDIISPLQIIRYLF